MADQADTPQVPQREPRFADAAAFGRFLQAHRQERKISLQHVSNDTKIPERHLAALERGDIAQWPGGIYRRAMIRAYAAAIRLNPNEMADEFAALFGDHSERLPEALPEPKPTEHDRPSAGSHMGVVVSIVCAAVAAAFAWYGLSITKEMAPPSVVAKPLARPESVGTSGTTTLASVMSQPLPSTPSAEVVAPEATPAPLSSVNPESSVTAESSVNPESTLQVTTEPAGAQVTVNGIRWGETPLTIRHLPPGEKQLRLTKDGYVSVERQVQLTNDDLLQTLSVDLEVGP